MPTKRFPVPQWYLRRMSYVRCLRGLASGIEYSADVPMNLDPADGRPVEMVLDLERLGADQPNTQWRARRFQAPPELVRYIAPLPKRTP